VLDASDGLPRVVEVNGIPGWKGAQQVLDIRLASEMIALAALAAGQRAETFAADSAQLSCPS